MVEQNEADIARELEELKEMEANAAKIAQNSGGNSEATGADDELVSKASAPRRRGPPTRKTGSTNLI